MERPVIVHRAVLGSVERMFAILTEHFNARWPFWLNPRQVMVVPITDKSYAYALEVKAAVRKVGLYCDADLSNTTMQKKVRAAQLSQYNYILVVGEKEAEEKTVNVRTRDNIVHGMRKVGYRSRYGSNQTLHCLFLLIDVYQLRMLSSPSD